MGTYDDIYSGQRPASPHVSGFSVRPHCVTDIAGTIRREISNPDIGRVRGENRWLWRWEAAASRIYLRL